MVQTLITVSISEDESTDGGFAFIDLGRKIMRSSIILSFRRLNAEPRHLGKGGWQPEVCWLPPNRVDQSGPSTIIHVGPVVVDQISELDPIEITVRGEHEAFPVVHWPALTPSLQGLATDVSILAPEEKPVPVVEVTSSEREDKRLEHLIDLVAAELETDAFTETGEVQSDRRGQWSTISARTDAVQTPKIDQGTGSDGGSGLSWRTKVILAVLFSVALIAIVVGLVMLKRPSEPITNGGEGPTQSPTLDSTPRPKEEQLEIRLRDLIARNADGSEFEELGREAVRSGYGRFAIRAFDEADPARRPEASWQLARFYDPRVSDEVYRRAAHPNVGWAITYYNMGAAAGSERHRNELRAMCSEYASIVAREQRLRRLCPR